MRARILGRRSGHGRLQGLVDRGGIGHDLRKSIPYDSFDLIFAQYLHTRTAGPNSGSTVGHEPARTARIPDFCERSMFLGDNVTD
ncbi:hypothetical protein B2J88_42840 [Rhodococcus sp. SRB_17]|nr:hypothetical protein [Rhodococcus sp. SRB_17]